MAGLKRRPDEHTAVGASKQKRAKIVIGKPAAKPRQTAPPAGSSGEESEDFSSEQEQVTPGELAKKDPLNANLNHKRSTKVAPGVKSQNGDKKFQLSTSSAEAHATQRALAKERKANKPNADLIQRSKKIWERLRRKSHVQPEERKALVEELYAIINGRVRDFVFKHDSVRVIQCALKYANKEQRLNITRELQTDMRALVESKYGKFMVAKIVVEGDVEVRRLVIPEFYGHIRRLINHPEAAWIVDDIYRQVATPDQKAHMLREWYGAEFALDNKVKSDALKKDKAPTADLATILVQSPEKRKPIMQNLNQLINALVQKKMTGFTMLHDAMLQYFSNLPTGSEEANEFLENLKSDLDDPSGGGDLLKNLAFTKSGSKVVCLALAYGGAKDRKQIIRVYRDIIETMAFDAHAYQVLLTAMEVTDDTKMSAKAVYPDLLFENMTNEEERDERLIAILTHRTARITILYPLAGDAKWLVPAEISTLLTEIHTIRETTSKKAAPTRHTELAKYTAEPLLSLVARRAEVLAQTTPGCQAVTEILLTSPPHAGEECFEKAVDSLVALCAGDPADEQHISHVAAAGKMLRTLCQGGKFDPETKAVVKSDRDVGFAARLYSTIGKELIGWASGPSSFVVVAMVESDALEEAERKQVIEEIRKGKKKLQDAASGKGTERKGNAGAKILLEKV